MAHVRSYAPEKPCEYCGTPYKPRMDLVRKGMGRFCSIKCSNHSRRLSRDINAPVAIRAYEEGMTIHQVATSMKVPWRVVRDTIHQAGIMRRCGQKLTNSYLTTYTPEGGRAYVHTAVATESLGRPLRKNEVVHHIDGDKLNNDPSNLMVMSRRQHGLQHRQLEQLAFVLVKKGLILHNKEDGYTFSSEMEQLLNYA